MLALAGTGLARDGLTIDNKHNERVSTPEAEKIYSSACSVVQREFGFRHVLHPQVRLILGADKNEVRFAGREIRLTKWDRYTFAQGVRSRPALLWAASARSHQSSKASQTEAGA